MRRRTQALTTLPIYLLLATSALAEGTDQLNSTQALRQTTQLYVDMTADALESVRWVGVGSVQVTDPMGEPLALLSSGQSVSAARGDGAYGLLLLADQVVGTRWDVAVESTSDTGIVEEQLGRLHSYDWKFNAGAFSRDRATFASFYALLPGGAENTDAVVELKLDGLAGYIFNLNANRTGVDGAQAGRSVSQLGNSVTPEFPIYLSPPAKAQFGRIAPDVSGFNFAGGVGTDVAGNSIVPCTELIPGQSQGRFFFSTRVDGTYHIECDLSQDGQFDGGQSDLLLIGSTVQGTNLVPWDGAHNGQWVPEGDYSCEVSVNVGEFHYVGQDIETSYPGMRMFEVLSDGSRAGLTMHWNDALVQAAAQLTPGGVVGSADSGPSGVASGSYWVDAEPNTNARSWGAFNSRGKGNQAFLDTYVLMESAQSARLTLSAVAGQLDSDGDGLTDFEERCSIGSDPASIDTDGDGTEDGEQYSAASSGIQGGLESNGRMGAALARRAIEQSRISPAAAFALSTSTPLSHLVPTVNESGLTVVESTPRDLTSLTNADDVYAVDYVSPDGQGKATLLLIETESALYEHNKAACSRASGASLANVAVWSLDQNLSLSESVVSATYRSSKYETLDQTVSFKLYEQENGSLRLHSRWLSDDYPPVASGQRVVNVQLWSAHEGLVRSLLGDFLKHVDTGIGLDRPQWILPVDDSEFAHEHELALEQQRQQRMPTTLPSAYIEKGSVLGAEVQFTPKLLTGAATNAIRLTFLEETGSGQRVEEVPLLNSAPWSRSFEPFVDVTVEVLADDKVVDRVWFSDGSWAAYDDAIWGGDTEVRKFTSSECTPRQPPSTIADTGALYLSGCASSEASVVDYAGVARHLAAPLELNQWNALAFFALSDKDFDVCLEDTESGLRACADVPASPQGQWYTVQLNSFEGTSVYTSEVPSKARLVSFSSDSPGENRMQVSGLTFVDSLWVAAQSERETTRPSETFWGCSVTHAQWPGNKGWPWALVLTVWGILLRRRRMPPGSTI